MQNQTKRNKLFLKEKKDMANGDNHLSIMRSIFNIFILLSITGCNTFQSTTSDKMKLYNDILSQLFDERCQYCSADPEGFITRKYESLIHKKIDSVSYFKTLDSLRSGKLPKRCLLEYSEELHILYLEGNKIDEQMKSSIANALHDTFIHVNFPQSNILSITDTLSLKASLVANDFSGNCMAITPYVRNPNDPFRNGWGVLGFSKVFYNDNGTQAVVYYEFMCGRSCGRGEVVFLDRQGATWKIINSKRLWAS